MAFQEEHSKEKLKRIFRFEEFDKLKSTEESEEGEEKKKGKKTAEKSSGARGGTGKSEELTGEDILGKEQISDEEFDKALEKIMKSGEERKFTSADQQI